MSSPRWPDAWYIACRSRDLRARPLALTVAGHRCALFRDDSGAPHAVEDRCAHRGAPLSAGRVEDGLLACPYHGWRYDGTGRVCEVPALAAGCAVPGEAKVAAFPVRECQGYVWLWTGSGEARGDPHCFAHLDAPGWTHFRMRNVFKGSVAACLENFLDCPHATFVHRGWFRSPTRRTVRATVRTTQDGAVAEYFEEPRLRSVVWTLLAPRRGAMTHTDRFIAPNVSQVDYDFPGGRHYTITSCCTPRAPEETLVHTVVSFRFRFIGPLVRVVFEPLSRAIIRQDVNMMARVSRNRAHAPEAGLVSTPADLLGPHIAAWHRALRDGSPVPAADVERHVEIRL